MVITYRMLTKMLKLRHVAGYCSACFLSSGYIAVFIVPSTWSFYLTSVLIGIAAAGKFLSHQLSWNIRYQIFFTIMLKRPLWVFKIHVCTSMQNIVRAVDMLRHPHRDLRIAISQYAGKLQSFKNLLWFWSFVYFQLLSPAPWYRPETWVIIYNILILDIYSNSERISWVLSCLFLLTVGLQRTSIFNIDESVGYFLD